MRDYNSATDYRIIEESFRQDNEGTLVQFKLALEEAGIRWPANFNSNTDPVAVQLDKDICRACGH